MSYLKVLLVAVLLLALAGCTSTYTRQTVTPVQTRLASPGAVLIAVPSDGSYGDQSYPASGVATASAVRSAFSRYSDDVELADACRDVNCLTANAKPFAYYVVPQILHWEDRATEWSGKSDRIEIKITVYDRGATAIASQVITGKSKWATFGGDHPQDLLPEPVNAYVKALYQ